MFDRNRQSGPRHRLFAGMVLLLAPGVGLAQSQAKSPGLTPVDPGFGDVSPLRTSLRQLQTDLRIPSSFDRVYRLPGSTQVYGAFGGGWATTTGAGSVGGIGFGMDRYARINGGLTAVFPRSEYFQTQNGVLAAIPTNTTFYIGKLPTFTPGRTGEAGGQVSPNLASSSVSTQVFTDVPAMQVGGVAAGSTGPVASQVSRPEVPLAENQKAPAVDPQIAAAEAARRAQPRSAPAAGMLTDENYRQGRIRELLAAAAKVSKEAGKQKSGAGTTAKDAAGR